MTWQLNNGEVNDEMTAVNGNLSPENVEGNDEVKGVLTWQLNNNGTAFNGEFSPGKSMLTWQLDNNNNGERLTAVNGDGDLTAEMKNMLTCQMNNGDGYTPVNVNDGTKGMLTCQLPATDETIGMLTWQNNEEDENELSKFLEEAYWREMMTCQNTKVKIINDPYWLPLKFQTDAAYVTINGNEELCGSSFSDSDTSYMAGISGAWTGVADEARGWMEGEVEEDEDEMLARFLGEGVDEMRGD